MLLDLIYVRKPYPTLVSELSKRIPLRVNLELFKVDPLNVIRLLRKGGDPFFPERR